TQIAMFLFVLFVPFVANLLRSLGLKLGAEHEFEPTRCASSNGAGIDDVRYLSEAATDRRRIACQAAHAARWVLEDGMVEQIVCRCPEVQSQTFGQQKALLQRTVHFKHTRPRCCIASEVSPCALRRK